jgi:hypothetical protein
MRGPQLTRKIPPPSMASETFFGKMTQTHYRSQLPALTLEWLQAHNLRCHSCGYTEVCYRCYGSFSEKFKKLDESSSKSLKLGNLVYQSIL